MLIELERIYGRRIYDKEDVPGEINYLMKLKGEELFEIRLPQSHWL